MDKPSNDTHIWLFVVPAIALSVIAPFHVLPVALLLTAVGVSPGRRWWLVVVLIAAVFALTFLISAQTRDAIQVVDSGLAKIQSRNG